MSDSIDWHQSDELVVRAQMGIVLYLNEFGELVIRQEGYLNPDCYFVIAPVHVPKLISAMQETLGRAVTVTRAKDRTAGDRQRRHRGKKRHNSEVDRDVTSAAIVTGRDGTVRKDGSLPLCETAREGR